MINLLSKFKALFPKKVKPPISEEEKFTDLINAIGAMGWSVSVPQTEVVNGLIIGTNDFIDKILTNPIEKLILTQPMEMLKEETPSEDGCGTIGGCKGCQDRGKVCPAKVETEAPAKPKRKRVKK